MGNKNSLLCLASMTLAGAIIAVMGGGFWGGVLFTIHTEATLFLILAWSYSER